MSEDGTVPAEIAIAEGAPVKERPPDRGLEDLERLELIRARLPLIRTSILRGLGISEGQVPKDAAEFLARETHKQLSRELAALSRRQSEREEELHSAARRRKKIEDVGGIPADEVGE